MGASNSKVEEDKALQLCRERRKFVRHALDGRCSLAAAHVAYIHSLKSTGTSLWKFVEPEPLNESSLYTSTSATPEPPAFTEKSLSHFSLSSPPLSRAADGNLSPSPSPPPPPLSSRQFHANHMKFRGFSSQKVEENPPVAIVGTATTSSSTPQYSTPLSTGKQETLPFDDASAPAGTAPWDFFQVFPPIDHEFSYQEGKDMNQGLEPVDDLRRLREEEGIPELEEDGENATVHESEESQESEDEFDNHSNGNLVRSFDNLARVHERAETSSPLMPSLRSVTSETEFVNGEKCISPELSPVRTPSSVPVSADTKRTPVKEGGTENKVSPKDFLSSIKEIEYLFIKASDAGKEIPRMLEANKLHFRPIVPSKENGSVVSTFLKACFACGDDPSIVQEEPAPTAVKYLTWHRTNSTRSSPSRNAPGLDTQNDADDLPGNLYENFCMISGSHASTLDRLYAWERKLYDEVKASELVRRDYDSKCKFLRELESKGESSHKIDKTRAAVKDLHSRIRIAIHRIDSISKRIEELRDNELQPQLEELIEGLKRMWVVMFECHKLQFNIIAIAIHGNAMISMQSDSRKQLAIHLENELSSLSSSFTKWIGAQKSYLEAINNWLFKCVFLCQKPSKRNRRQPTPSSTLRNHGAPVYVTCGVWLEKLEALPVKDVAESIKVLAAVTGRFLPRQERNQGRNMNVSSWKSDIRSESSRNMLREEETEDCISGIEQFRSGLVGFLHQLNTFSESSVQMYTDLGKEIQVAKSNYEHSKSQG